MRSARGRMAAHRLKCYLNVPQYLASVKTETFKDDNITKVPNMKYMTVGEICRLISGKTYTPR